MLLTLGRKQVTMSEVYTGGVFDQAAVRLVRRTAEGCGLECGLKPAIRRFLMTLTRSILTIAFVALAQQAVGAAGSGAGGSRA